MKRDLRAVRGYISITIVAYVLLLALELFWVGMVGAGTALILYALHAGLNTTMVVKFIFGIVIVIEGAVLTVLEPVVCVKGWKSTAHRHPTHTTSQGQTPTTSAKL